jgi:hypothetical protein
MFSALSFDHGNLSEKINLFIALAPIVTLNDINGMLPRLTGIKETLDTLGIYELNSPK